MTKTDPDFRQPDPSVSSGSNEKQYEKSSSEIQLHATVTEQTDAGSSSDVSSSMDASSAASSDASSSSSVSSDAQNAGSTSENQSESKEQKDHAVVSTSERFVQITEVLHKYKAIKGMTPQKLRLILEDLGPTYVKLGQIMSSRQDLIPAEYAKELQKLRSDVEPMPYEVVEQEIVAAYGKTPDELFASFNRTPLGSASMAQVHQAVTKDGEDVVIKVQRPHLYEQMKVDVAMMKKAAKLLSLNSVISGLVDLDDVIDEFWTTAKQEMDFRHEAANAIRFAQENDSVPYLHIPKIYTEYTRPNMLVMEEVKGVEIDNYPTLEKGGYSREEIATKLGMNFIDQVVERGFFHADPHSGNLKIVGDKIVWLDFGMMGELSKGEASEMFTALRALAARDLSGLTDAVLQIGIPPENLDYIGFSNALEDYLGRYVNESFSDLDLGNMVTEAVEICRNFGIRLPKGITLLARSLVTIQGTLKDLDSNVNMLTYISREKTSIDSIDWQKEIEKFLKTSYASLNALSVLPGKVDHVVTQLERGRLQVGLKIVDLPSVMPQIDHLVDRLVVCILIAALLMGSSIICTTGMKPTFLGIPLLGFAGFFISFCLSLWLFYKMLFKRSKGNKLF